MTVHDCDDLLAPAVPAEELEVQAVHHILLDTRQLRPI